MSSIRLKHPPGSSNFFVAGWRHRDSKQDKIKSPRTYATTGASSYRFASRTGDGEYPAGLHGILRCHPASFLSPAVLRACPPPSPGSPGRRWGLIGYGGQDQAGAGWRRRRGKRDRPTAKATSRSALRCSTVMCPSCRAASGRRMPAGGAPSNEELILRRTQDCVFH
jgi:hypothetical protein